MREPPGPPRNDRPAAPASPQEQIDIISLMLWGLIWTAGLFTSVSAQWRKSEKEVLQSQADKARVELSFFKAQINPHFLFNTLNNLYALAAGGQNPETASGILKLSRIMRYITEESTAALVPMTNEIEFIRNYIELQRLRLNACTKVDLQITGSFETQRVAPMIFITFIENAFKYGVSAHRESVIEVGLEEKDSGILFYCKNPITRTGSMETGTGIGISNTRRRLDYMYPSGYTLTLSDKNGYYSAELYISPQKKLPET